MKRIQREQAPQKSKIDQPAVTGIPIQRKLPDQKIGALPANDVCVRYQPTPDSTTGGGIIQCCYDDVPVTGQQQPENPRHDGPCAIYAIYCLGWEPGYTKENGNNENRIQNDQFGALGTEMEPGYQLSALQDKQVLVEFFKLNEKCAFHVMFTDGNGHLRGTNNDTDMLKRVLGTPDTTDYVDADGCISCIKNMLSCVFGTPDAVLDYTTGECILKMDGLTVRADPVGYVRCIKYVTKDEYLSNTPRLESGTNL